MAEVGVIFVTNNEVGGVQVGLTNGPQVTLATHPGVLTTPSLLKN